MEQQVTKQKPPVYVFVIKLTWRKTVNIGKNNNNKSLAYASVDVTCNHKPSHQLKIQSLSTKSSEQLMCDSVNNRTAKCHLEIACTTKNNQKTNA